jgi:hypothetical protein
MSEPEAWGITVEDVSGRFFLCYDLGECWPVVLVTGGFWACARHPLWLPWFPPASGEQPRVLMTEVFVFMSLSPLAVRCGEQRVAR